MKDHDPASDRGPLVTRAFREFGNDHCPLLAAAISYHVLFAFVPLVTLLVATFGLVMRNPASRQAAADRLVQLLPFQGSESNLMLDLIRNVSSQTGTLTVIGVLGLLWSSTGLFGSIRSALNIAWDVKDKRGFLTDALIDIAAVIGFGLLFAVSMLGTVMLHSLETSQVQLPWISPNGPLHSILAAGLLLPALVSFIGFVLLFRLVPNVRHRVGDVWLGALLAAVLFEVGKHGFAFYVAHFNRYQVLYGALGGVMLFMLWTYVSAIALLLGAELAAAQERGRHGEPVPARPDSDTHAPRDTFDDVSEKERRDRAAYAPH